MAMFEVCKMFYLVDMPPDVKKEFSSLRVYGVAGRIDLIGHDNLPLTRAWLLANGAEKSDGFVYIWID